VSEIPIGIEIGPELEISPQDLVGVEAYACIAVYTVEPFAIEAGEEILLL
jgi:hypothetical protein